MAGLPPPTSFSSDAEGAIARAVEFDPRRIRERDASIEEFYEIEQTVAQIVQHGFKRVALQFPDEMLQDSVPLYLALNARLNEQNHTACSLFVLADTSYGSCCVDEVAAQHVNADAVVHYGHACLSPTTRLPSIYIYGKRSLDHGAVANAFLDSLSGSLPTRIQIRGDVAFHHAFGGLLNTLKSRLSDVEIQAASLPRFKLPQADQRGLQRETSEGSAIARDGDTVLFIGEESLAFTNALMTGNGVQMYRYDPSSSRCISESYKTNRLLMRRYALMQKARDADVFGILVGTLGVASYLHLIARLRKMLTDKGKKTYTISVGKLNPAKLANFAEIECFVFVACPENSIIESRDFQRPIVTPFELEIALGLAPAWDGRYILDFDKVIGEANAYTPLVAEGSDESEPEFSLISGKYRQAKRYGTRPTEKEREGGNGQALVSRSQDRAVARVLDSASGDFLKSRSWQGLEQRIGEDEPSLLEQGRTGIAKGYREVDHPHVERN